MATDVPRSATLWKERIVRNPQILSGKPIINGTRLSVEFITDLIAGNRTTEDITRSYPFITPDDIEACIQYKAAGKKLSPTTWGDVDRMMDEADAQRPSLLLSLPIVSQ